MVYFFHRKFNWLEHICLLSHQYFENIYNYQFHTSIAMQWVQSWNTFIIAQHRPLQRSPSPPGHRGTESAWCPTWAHQPCSLHQHTAPGSALLLLDTCSVLTVSFVLVLNSWMHTNLYTPSLLIFLLCFALKADLERMTKRQNLGEKGKFITPELTSIYLSTEYHKERTDPWPSNRAHIWARLLICTVTSLQHGCYLQKMSTHLFLIRTQ